MIFKIFMVTIFMIPFYTFLIWTFNRPEDSVLLGRRWMYQEDPEISLNAIRYMKFASIFAMIGTPIIILSAFWKIRIFGLLLIPFTLTFVIGALIILTGEHN